MSVWGVGDCIFRVFSFCVALTWTWAYPFVDFMIEGLFVALTDMGMTHCGCVCVGCVWGEGERVWFGAVWCARLTAIPCT